MDAVITEVPIKKIKIDGNDIYLENFETGKGKITITTPNGLSYSYFWGAMGSDLEEFITRINADYFAKNLIRYSDMYEMDVKSTFKTIRKFIRTEIGLDWYQEMEFQKQMREVLNDFQKECEDNKDRLLFVNWFESSFLRRLDTYLIQDDYIEKQFDTDSGCWSEVWNFIEEKPTMEYMRLKMLHTKLVKHLKKQK
jgi:hypothetical protein